MILTDWHANMWDYLFRETLDPRDPLAKMAHPDFEVSQEREVCLVPQ